MGLSGRVLAYGSGTEAPDGIKTQLELFSCLEKRCLETKGVRNRNASVGKTILLSYVIITMVSKNLAGLWPKPNWAHLHYLLKNKAEESFVKVTATTCVTLWLYNYKVILFINLLYKLGINRRIYHQKAPLIPYHRAWSHR